MEKYIDQVNKKPVLEYTPENILKKRRKNAAFKDNLAMQRAKKVIRMKEKYKLRSDFKKPE